jgi:ribosomal-protein-alanine N-acetyltransferase
MLVIPKVRLATQSDASGIAEMSRDFIEHGLGWSWTQLWVQKAIRDASTNVAVIQERGCTLAFGIMQYGDDKAHLALLGVHRAHRQRGLGAHVVSWLEKSAQTAGIWRIRVEARADNLGAIAFYLRVGYKAAGRLPGYYQGVLDAVRFEKHLWSQES